MQLVSENLKADDTGVLRYTVSAKQMTKDEILTKLGYKSEEQQKNVKFDDFKVLSFEARREVSLAVFEQELKVNKFEDQLTDVLVGDTGFKVQTTIFGSPLPEVVWYINDTEVTKDNQKYSTAAVYGVIFYLTVKLGELNNLN